MKDKEIQRLFEDIEHGLNFLILTLKDQKDNLDILGRRLNEIEAVLYNHKEVLESLTSYRQATKGKKVYIQ